MLSTSVKLTNVPVSDQGSGVFDIKSTYKMLEDDKQLAPYVYPEKLDLTSYEFSPFSGVSFYSTMTPIAFNFTIINTEEADFTISSIRWEANDAILKQCLRIDYEKSDGIIPSYALIRMKISVQSNTECQYAITRAENIVTYVSFKDSNVTAKYTLTMKLIPTPPRSERILFDSFHNLKFPEDGYILRDSIFIDKQPYEWKGDHVFTNYMQLYKFLGAQGYFVEVLNEPITCFDSK